MRPGPARRPDPGRVAQAPPGPPHPARLRDPRPGADGLPALAARDARGQSLLAAGHERDDFGGARPGAPGHARQLFRRARAADGGAAGHRRLGPDRRAPGQGQPGELAHGAHRQHGGRRVHLSQLAGHPLDARQLLPADRRAPVLRRRADSLPPPAEPGDRRARRGDEEHPGRPGATRRRTRWSGSSTTRRSCTGRATGSTITGASTTSAAMSGRASGTGCAAPASRTPTRCACSAGSRPRTRRPARVERRHARGRHLQPAHGRGARQSSPPACGAPPSAAGRRSSARANRATRSSSSCAGGSRCAWRAAGRRRSSTRSAPGVSSARCPCSRGRRAAPPSGPSTTSKWCRSPWRPSAGSSRRTRPSSRRWPGWSAAAARASTRRSTRPRRRPPRARPSTATCSSASGLFSASATRPSTA